MIFNNRLSGYKIIGTDLYLLRCRLLLYILLPLLFIYFLYTLNIVLSSANHSSTEACPTTTTTSNHLSYTNNSKNPETRYTEIGLEHIVFGIAASAHLWDKRKEVHQGLVAAQSDVGLCLARQTCQ
jgi:hypothetical protein